MVVTWNRETERYSFEFTQEELGNIIFSLSMARLETHSPAVAELQDEMLKGMRDA
jgi:hypothetical protein